MLKWSWIVAYHNADEKWCLPHKALTTQLEVGPQRDLRQGYWRAVQVFDTVHYGTAQSMVEPQLQIHLSIFLNSLRAALIGFPSPIDSAYPCRLYYDTIISFLQMVIERGRRCARATRPVEQAPSHQRVDKAETSLVRT